jgi:hypothetical protein
MRIGGRRVEGGDGSYRRRASGGDERKRRKTKGEEEEEKIMRSEEMPTHLRK